MVDLALPGLYRLHAVSVCLVYTGYTQFCSVWFMQVTCNVALSGLQCSDECCSVWFMGFTVMNDTLSALQGYMQQ